MLFLVLARPRPHTALGLARSVSPLAHPRCFSASAFRRDLSRKYLDKVQKVANEKGVSVEELRSRTKELQLKPKVLPEAQKLYAERDAKAKATPASSSTKAKAPSSRKDNSPVKPLAEVMDVHKLFRTPHTAEQVSALWTAFHASRSGGTGRGYLSASVPLTIYTSLVEKGKKSPNFIIPLPRQGAAESNNVEDSYEFFFLQWLFHPTPPIPAPTPLDEPLPEGAQIASTTLPTSTILFTPLLEYKTRTTFATPHLVLTLYPDLSSSHNIVLLRGELTPSPNQASEGKFLLSQQDAQLLALGMQRFYLANAENDDGQKERAELLRVFSEEPESFKWENLLKHANPTA